MVEITQKDLVNITSQGRNHFREENKQNARQIWAVCEEAIKEAYNFNVKCVWILTNANKRVIAMLLNRINTLKKQDPEFFRLGLEFKFFQIKDVSEEIKVRWDAKQEMIQRKQKIIVKRKKV